MTTAENSKENVRKNQVPCLKVGLPGWREKGFRNLEFIMRWRRDSMGVVEV